MTPELEAALGPRIDTAVDKVSGLLPVEWSTELRATMRELVDEAHSAGARESLCFDAEIRRAF